MQVPDLFRNGENITINEEFIERIYFDFTGFFKLKGRLISFGGYKNQGITNKVTDKNFFKGKMMPQFHQVRVNKKIFVRKNLRTYKLNMFIKKMILVILVDH